LNDNIRNFRSIIRNINKSNNEFGCIEGRSTSVFPNLTKDVAVTVLGKNASKLKTANNKIIPVVKTPYLKLTK
jgi:hypothetical protein